MQNCRGRKNANAKRGVNYSCRKGKARRVSLQNWAKREEGGGTKAAVRGRGKSNSGAARPDGTN